MQVVNQDGVTLVVISKDRIIFSVQDMLDTMASAQYEHDCAGLAVYKGSLDESFFDLRSGFAGEVLQKFTNYQMKLAVIGDFSQYSSKSLKDLIYECNSGRTVFFKASLTEGLEAMSQAAAAMG